MPNDRRKLATTVMLAGLVVAHAAPGVTALRPVRTRFFPRLTGLGHPDHVALTFDDGPDPVSTPGFLDVLACHRVRATFFLLGTMVAKTPQLAADIAAAGHEVAVHGWEHRYTLLRTPWDVRADMIRARDAVAEASGAVPAFYRPPYGVLSAGALIAARQLELTPVLWNCSGKEWAPGATPWSVGDNLVAGLAGGGTILLHDCDSTAPGGTSAAALAALPRLLKECQAAGLRIGPLAEHGLHTFQPSPTRQLL